MFDLLMFRVSSLTQAARKVARGVRSSLALLLCVIVLAAAVDFDFTTNDTLLREWMLSWVEDDTGDDAHATAYGDAAINEKFSVGPLENDSRVQTVRPEIHSASVAISFDTRAPPLFVGIGAHPLVSFEPTRRSLSSCNSSLRLASAAPPDCAFVRSEAELLFSTSIRPMRLLTRKEK